MRYIIPSIVLSNSDRRKHYDRFGTVDDDQMMEDDFFKNFEGMFFGSSNGTGDDFFDHFDDYTNFLEKDTKFMHRMFKDMGKDLRSKGKRRKQGGMRGGMGDLDEMAFGMSMAMGAGIGGGDMEDMLTFMMMGSMMGGGAGGSMSKKNKKKK
jgi:hypothetical protein